MNDKKFKFNIAISLLFIFVSAAYIGYQITSGGLAQKTAGNLIGQTDVNDQPVLYIINCG